MTEERPTPSSPEQVPLIIGLIGHRDLRPTELGNVSQAIREVVTDIVDRAGEMPVWMLTSLAEGADQIAIEVCREVSGLEIVALLPMPIDDYSEDFAEGGPRQRLHELLAECSRVLVADELGPPEARGARVCYQSSNERDDAYRRCGRLISDCSHVLIAVWDGKHGLLPGGTADTLAYRSSSSFSSLAQSRGLWGPLGGVTIHIPAGRLSHEDPPSLGTDSGEGSGPHLIEVCADEQGGTSHARWRPWRPGLSDAVIGRLAQANDRLVTLKLGRPERTASHCRMLMCAYDEDALALSTRYRRSAASLLFVGVLVLLQVSVEQSLTVGWVLASAVATIGLTGILWLFLTRIGLKTRYEEARGVAEGARVQIAWLECGITESVADTYLQADADMQWVRRLLKSAWLSDLAFSNFPGASPQEQAAAAYAWIQGQVSYFDGGAGKTGAIARNRSKARRYEWLSGCAIAVAFASLIPEVARAWTQASVPAWVTVVAQTGWELGISVAAAGLAYAQLMAFGETARRFEVSLKAFRQARSQLQRLGGNDLEQIQAVARSVGQEALNETGAWLAMHRDRSARPV